MNNKKIAVMAGTPIDTQFGINLLSNFSNNIISIPVSPSPDEQTIFQTINYEKRFNHIKSLIEKENIDFLFVYCNSLSASVDFNEISKICRIPLVTPLHFYENITKLYSSIGVLSANAQGGAGIEKVIINKNPNIKLYSFSNIEWVKAIENSINPEIIFDDLGLKEAIHFFEKVKTDCILLGCTHFPYFSETIQEKTKISCISPANFMIDTLKNFLNIK